MATRISPLAGKPAPPSLLVDVARLVTACYTEAPDPAVPAQRVAFGTSGHRGSSFDVSIYAESFIGTDHLQRILTEAQTIVDRAIASPSPTSRGRD